MKLEYLELLRIISSDHQVVQQITRVISPLGLPPITPNYFALPPIYFEFLWITQDYHCGLSSGPADYQSCFLFGITADYAELLRISLELLRFTSNYFGLPRITSADYQVVQRITGVLSPSELPRITPNYSALAPDYSDSLGLRRITLDYLDYSDLLRITADHPGSFQITPE